MELLAESWYDGGNGVPQHLPLMAYTSVAEWRVWTKGQRLSVFEVGAKEGTSNLKERGKRCNSRYKARRTRVAFGEDRGSNGTGGKGY